MGTSYKSTIELRCWKKHTCGACSSGFRYRFQRIKTGQGATETAASAAAQAAVLAALAHEVDIQPCPTCGLYQPDMIAAQRARRHVILLLIALVGMALPLILGLAEAIALGTAAWIEAVVAVVVLLGHIQIASSNPNRSPDANREQAMPALESGTLELCRPGERGTAAGDVAWHRWNFGHVLMFLFMGVGAVAAASPELLRLVSGWPLNSGWYPQVVGPGDYAHIYFEGKRVSSVKGYWKGVAQVEVLNARDLGLPNPPRAPGVPPASQLRAESKNDNWGMSIQAKSRDKSNSSALWTRVYIPDQANLAGKKLDLKMHLAATYPALVGNMFQNQTTTFEQTASLELASPGAGGIYHRLWWLGGLAAGLLVLLGSAGLARLANNFRRQAQPTSVYPLGPPTEAEGEPLAESGNE